MEIKTFIDGETSKILETYKAETGQVWKYVFEALEKNQNLKELVNEKDEKDIYRTRLYKDFFKKTKKDIYYSLRTFKKSSGVHVSSAERAEFIGEFNDTLSSNLSFAQNILDLGGGTYIEEFPFSSFPLLKNYVWVDNDTFSYKKVLEFKSRYTGKCNVDLRFEALEGSIWKDYLPEGVLSFDVVFLFKFISLIWRQERELFPYLYTIPSAYFVVTMPKESLTKNESIEARERKILNTFIKNSGFEVTAEADFPNEFLVILKNPSTSIDF